MQAGTRGKRRLVAEINVVPYIDVMLVLLVVFMITSPMLMQGVDVELPEAPSEPLPENEREPLIVSIKEDGGFYVDVGGDEETARPLEEIVGIVEAIIEENPDTPVLVWGDKRVAYGEVISLMTELQRAGTIRVGLVTEPPSLGN